MPSNLQYQLVRQRAIKTKETHLLSKCKSKTGFLGRLGKVLVLNGEVTNSERILRDETLHGTGTILNRELGTIGLVG